MSQRTNCLGIIPVRLTSTRLPGKPLKEIGGKTLVQRVWEQGCKVQHLTELVIATDDKRIAEHGACFGAKVIMTGSHHQTGSDRVAEVLKIYEEQGRFFPFIANIQGDMPFINPALIDQTILALSEAESPFDMSTACTPIFSEDEFQRPSAVKVVMANDHRALYFSRSPVPFIRDKTAETPGISEPWGYKHLGLYVFRPEALKSLNSLPVSFLEKRERLEQLRALAGGLRIRVTIASGSLAHPGIEVDTEEDLQRARKFAAGICAGGDF